MNRRVVVTGTGVISPVGLNTKDMWDALVNGKSGVDRITLFDTTSFETKIAAEVKGFEAHTYVDRKEARHMDRFTQFAVAASLQAVEESRLKINSHNAEQIGILIGSGIGGISTLCHQHQILLERGPDRVSPFSAPMMVADTGPGQVAIILGIKGPNFCTVSSCSSGSDAIGTACRIIQSGDARVMIAGGSEAAVVPLTVAAFNSARAISTRNDDPKGASRPFDAQRDGFVLGEGAGILILEELSFAQERGAHILAEVLGYGATGDAFHITQPAHGGEGAVRAMKIALSKAGLKTDDIDYINAHGTSTALNDRNETMAFKAVFGDRAYHVPISSTKSMTGHLLGAAAALEAVISVQTIRHGLIPPTINLTNPDPECDLDYVPNVARQAKVKTALSTSLGFGGHNSVLIFREYNEAAG